MLRIARHDLVPSAIIAGESQAHRLRCQPPPLVSIFQCDGAVVSGGHRVAMDTTTVGCYCIRLYGNHMTKMKDIIFSLHDS